MAGVFAMIKTLVLQETSGIIQGEENGSQKSNQGEP